MTKRWYELGLNQISRCGLGTFLRNETPLLFELMFSDFWIRHYVHTIPKFSPNVFLWCTYDPTTPDWYERMLNHHSQCDFASFIKQVSPDLFQLMFFDFWLRHTPKQIRRAPVKTMQRYQDDPRLIKARFTSNCHKCGKPVHKGTEAYYWPKPKNILHLDCGQKDYNDFVLAARDEYFLSTQFRT